MKIKSDAKRIYWEISNRTGRFQYVNALLSSLPGELGLILRAMIIPRYFECAGENIILHPGIKYRCEYKLRLGNNVAIGIDNFLQASAGIIIGNHTLLGPGVKIWTVNHRFDDLDKPIIEQGYEKKPVTLGSNVWIGANVFIMPGVNLPDGCIVSAGAVVGVKNYQPYSIIAGNPARVIGNRKKAPQAETTNNLS